MTSKRRENINLVSFICLSFLVISFSKQLLTKQFKNGKQLTLEVSSARILHVLKIAMAAVSKARVM